MVYQRLWKLSIALSGCLGTYGLWLFGGSWLAACEAALYQQNYGEAICKTLVISLYLYLAIGFVARKNTFRNTALTPSPSDHVKTDSGLQRRDMVNIPAINRL
nr:hypothetical protein A6C57_00145 [Fibrella sp. ES10-3-2-2]